MTIEQDKINKLREILKSSAKNIAVISHVNPDGDAVGSGLGLVAYLNKIGHNAKFILPNKFPAFLSWIKGADSTYFYSESKTGVKEILDSTEVIICADFNQLSRLDALGKVVEENKKAFKILVDHHLYPSDEFDLVFSYPQVSSTSFVAYNLMCHLDGKEAMDNSIAEPIYVGMMTDTGNFSYGNLSPEIYAALGNLIECGVNPVETYNKVYNSFSVNRMKLLGYVLHDKLKFIKSSKVAYMSLTSEELKSFSYMPGDTEGIVNYPLMISEVMMSVLFTETDGAIKMSLRSRYDVDVNALSKAHFNGGGHKNAAGGKLFSSMEDAIAKFNEVMQEYNI